MNEKLVRIRELEALRWASKKKCIKGNCGAVCLCPPCCARFVLESWEAKDKAEKGKDLLPVSEAGKKAFKVSGM